MVCHGHDPGAETGDVGERGVVVRNDLLSTDGGIARRGVRIGHQHHRITQGQGFARGGVYTKLGVHAAHHQVLDTQGLQRFMKSCAQERVWRGFANAPITGLYLQACCQLPLRAAVLQVACTLLVVNEKHRHACNASPVRDHVDALYGARTIVRGIRAFAQALLNIDDEDGGLHRLSFLYGYELA
jgi:hypothetical protein